MARLPQITKKAEHICREFGKSRAQRTFGCTSYTASYRDNKIRIDISQHPTSGYYWRIFTIEDGREKPVLKITGCHPDTLPDMFVEGKWIDYLLFLEQQATEAKKIRLAKKGGKKNAQYT